MMCEYCKYRLSWECEERYASYPSCESFSLDWCLLSDKQRSLIEAILKMGDSCYDF